MLIHLISLLLAVAAGPASADGPVLDKPAPVSAHRAVPETTLRPPRPIDVLHYDLRLRVNADNAYLLGDVLVRLVPLRNLDDIVLDFTTTTAAPRSGMLARAVEVDGVQRSFTQDADSLVIDLGAPVTPADTLEVFVDFEGAPVRPEGVGFGWSRRLLRDENFEPDPDRPVLCSLSEPTGARTWWPCHDHPYDNATVTLTTIGPPQFRLAAPGTRTEDVDLGGGLRSQTFEMTTPIPAYLVSVILTDQVLWTETMTVDELLADGTIAQREMDLEYYAPEPLKPDCEYTWANTAEMVRRFSAMFGPYPYADIKYGMALFVFGGAMEHATLSSMGHYTVNQTQNLLYPGPSQESIVAHELAHQWFGDAVHVGRWGDIWLNEGFARYAEVLWIESFYGADYGKTWLERIRADSYAGPLRDPDGLFTGTVYNKGAWVLHQLRQVLGSDDFLLALRNYVTDPGLRFGPVFIEDFQAHCEAVYGASLEWYFGPWLEQEGRPALSVDWTETATGVSGRVSQPATRVYRLPLPVQLRLASGEVRDEIVWVGEAGAVDEFQIETSSPVVDLRIDAGRNWLLDLDVPARKAVELIGVRPNPFNPLTTVSFVVRRDGRVRVDVFDLKGRRVRSLFDEGFAPAVHQRTWDGTDDEGDGVASGVYVVRLRSDAGEDRQKVTLLR